MKRISWIASALCGWMVCVAAVQAQDYPSRPVRAITALVPGLSALGAVVFLGELMPRRLVVLELLGKVIKVETDARQPWEWLAVQEVEAQPLPEVPPPRVARAETL